MMVLEWYIDPEYVDRIANCRPAVSERVPATNRYLPATLREIWYQ